MKNAKTNQTTLTPEQAQAKANYDAAYAAGFAAGQKAANDEAVKNRMKTIRQRSFKFSDRGLALKSCERHMKPTFVMLGDDQMFWVVSPADAVWMEEHGFEYAD